MRCYCCDAETPVGRKVKLRPWRTTTAAAGLSADPFRLRLANYRWGVVCPACYERLDNDHGLGDVGGKMFNMAIVSRGGRAAVVGDTQ